MIDAFTVLYCFFGLWMLLSCAIKKHPCWPERQLSPAEELIEVYRETLYETGFLDEE